jgi:microcompartment protein CcmK/EutM
VILARVLGNVVATQKNQRYSEARIMLVQPVNPDWQSARRADARA